MSYKGICTASGLDFDYENISAENVSIYDIAAALSKNCRFNGHTPKFYSVAEHCCHMHDWAEIAEENTELAFFCILHDASEAYLTDVPRPLKNILPEYKQLENMVQTMIYKKYFGDKIELGPWVMLNVLDNRMLHTEAVKFFGRETVKGFFDDKWREIYPVFGHNLDKTDLYTINGGIAYWTPERAQDEFLKRITKYL